MLDSAKQVFYSDTAETHCCGVALVRVLGRVRVQLRELRQDRRSITHDPSVVSCSVSTGLDTVGVTALHFLQGRRRAPRLRRLRPYAETRPSVCCVCEQSKTRQRAKPEDIRLLREAAYRLFFSLMYSSVWYTSLWRSST